MRPPVSTRARFPLRFPKGRSSLRASDIDGLWEEHIEAKEYVFFQTLETAAP